MIVLFIRFLITKKASDLQAMQLKIFFIALKHIAVSNPARLN